MPSPRGRVLVTGATGFLGSAVARDFAQNGYIVRGTTRTLQKAKAWDRINSDVQIEWAIVPDQVTPGAYDEAMKDVTFLMHTSSPVNTKATSFEKELLQPAIDGTRNALEAATKTPSVKHIVITSSGAAMLDMTKGFWPGHTYTDDSWNPMTREEAIAPTSNAGFAYGASKTLAEKWAWEYHEQHKPQWDLTTLCPPVIFGPPHCPVDSMSQLTDSLQMVWEVIDGKATEIGPTFFPIGMDVRDVALAHRMSIEKPAAKNRRYLLVAWHWCKEEVAVAVSKAFPDRAASIPQPKGEWPVDHYATETSRSERDLEIQWIDFDTCVRDTAASLFELHGQVGD